MTTTCPDATVDLILREEPHLRGVARRLVRCESDSDDLVQETLLRAYHARDRFHQGTSVRAWTTTILRRVFITDARKARRRRLQTDTDAGGPLGSAVGALRPVHDDTRPIGDALDDVVKRALDRVPEVYRTSFVLSAVRDLSCVEIGRRLSVPPRTVMSRVQRAREKLRCELAMHRSELPLRAAQRLR